MTLSKDTVSNHKLRSANKRLQMIEKIDASELYYQDNSAIALMTPSFFYVIQYCAAVFLNILSIAQGLWHYKANLDAFQMHDFASIKLPILV